MVQKVYIYISFFFHKYTNIFFFYLECNESDFEYIFDINYGNCYRFNSGPELKKVIASGDTSGLQLGFYLGEQDKNRLLTYSTGIYLAIHNNSFQSILPDNGLNIPTSQLTSISNILIK